jgi:hypothetical protein
MITRILTLTVLAVTASVTHADVVTDWNATAISTDTGPATLLPARVLATMHAAMFDAAAVTGGRYRPILTDVEAPPGASAEAAVAAAAHTVLSRMTVGQQAVLDAALQRSVGTLPAGAAVTD